MSSAPCSHGHHAPAESIRSLPASQAGKARHCCAICAFHAGAFHDANYHGEPMESCPHGRHAPSRMLAALPESQAGFGRHKCCICAYAIGAQLQAELANEEAAGATQNREEAPENPPPFAGAPEGAEKKIMISVYERDPKNRREAVRVHGRTCAACGFNFDLFYGADFANGYIEIHHLIRVAELNGRTVNPATEMAALCSNCHSMAHRSRVKLTTVAEIKAAIEKRRAQNMLAPEAE